MQDHHQQEQETTLSLIRYSKLLKSYSAAFDAMKKECSFERFKVAFPMLARDNADFLECKRDEMFAKFKEKTFAEFLNIVKDQDLKVLLSELDEIAAETAAASLTADQEVDVAVDTDKLAPSQVVSAHQYAVKQAEAARLRAALLKEQEENKGLMEQAQLEMNKLRDSITLGSELMKSVVSTAAEMA